jgi:SPP1 gp7 family putative phage head morphogenesis protein
VAEEIENDDLTPVAKPRSAKTDAAAMEGLYFGTIEKSFKESAYHPDSMVRPYNPDQLVRQDYTYGVYEEMLMDDQVNVALNLKKELVVGSGWHIQSSDDDLKNELEAILQDEMERPLTEVLQDIIQSYEFGFSISEKLFKNLPDGRLALRDIRPRHPSTWLLHTDPHGNVTRYEQRAQYNSLDIDPSAIIHYVNNQRHQNPYGQSDLYAAYQAWVTKRHVTRFYAIFLENAAGPKPVAKYDRRAPAGVVEDIFNSIKKLQTKSALVIPKDFELEFLEAKNSGEAYIKGINLFNMFIGRALFIPDLLGFSGGETGGGSFSLGKEQIGLFYKHINRRRETLERIIDQHVIRPMCIYNYGMLEEFPKFKFNPLSDEDATKQAELWIKGVQGVGWEPTPEEVNHFRSLVKFPESDDLVMKADKAAMLAGQAQGPEGDGPEGGAPGDTAKDVAPDEEAKAEKPKEDEKKKEFGLKLDTLPGNYKAKVDFKLADQTLKTAVSKLMTEAQPIVDDIFSDLYDQLQKKKIVQRQDLDRADSIKLKYLGRLQGVFKKHFRQLHQDGKSQAMTEVKKSDFAAPLPNDEFLAFLESETYKYVGDWAYEITKKTKNELIKAIKDGMPLSSVTSVLDDEGRKLSEVSLERYSRTKTTEVFNRGRMDYFDSTGVVAAYQYSAILDDVTSETCGELNGLTFPAGEAPIPPLHFNCRSLLIPITRFEEWSADSSTNSGKSVERFLEKNVTDKGFSVYEAKDEPVIEAKTRPEISDAGVEIDTVIEGNTNRITYSHGGKAFQETVIVYDESRSTILSKKDKRLDNDPEVQSVNG